MIVSAVADPTAFGPSGITDELSKREALAFLRGIVSNGVLLDEPTKELLRVAISEASQLSTRMGQHLQVLLTEIRKQHKKLVVTCDRTSWQRQSTATIPAKCAAVAAILQADVVVTQPAHIADVQTRVGATSEVCLLSDASQSAYEASRIKLIQLEKPLDELSLPEIEEFVGRAVKYAPRIRFYDYLMISSPSRTRQFLAGLQFFAAIWSQWCVIGDESSRTIELYTVAKRQGVPGGFIDGAEANSRLESEIQRPLSEATRARVERHVKEDSDPRIFHARGFEARLRAFTIDPGFDAVGANGAVRRCLLKYDRAAEHHFADCRKLKDLP